MIQVQQSQLFVRSFRRLGILHQQLNCSTSLAAVVYAADTEVGLKAEITSDLRASEVVFSCVFGFRQWLIPIGR